MVPTHSPQSRTFQAILVGSALAFISTGSAGAAAFVPGDLATDRVADGTDVPIDSSANPLSIDDCTSGLDTAGLADDLATASGGAIQRWNVDGTAWNSSNTLNTGANGARGLAVDSPEATPTLYAMTPETADNRLITISDVGASSAFTVLTTEGINEAYRGLDFVPIPEPVAWAALIGGTALLALVRRRRSRSTHYPRSAH